MGLGTEEGIQPKNLYTLDNERNDDLGELLLKFLSKLKFELARNRTV